MDARHWRTAAILAAIAVAVGCGSKPVAPQRSLPPLTASDLARQAALLAAGIHAAANEVLGADAATDLFEVDIGNDLLEGTAVVDLRCAGPDGPPCAENDPQAAWLHASGRASVSLLAAMGLQLWLSFEFTADPFDPISECGLVRGEGIIVAGEYTSRFRLEEIGACAGAYPAAGRLVLEAIVEGGDGATAPPNASVEFDGTRHPTLLAGGRELRADLDSGDLLRP